MPQLHDAERGHLQILRALRNALGRHRRSCEQTGRGEITARCGKGGPDSKAAAAA
jgi:hypothetical protein